MKRSIYTPIPLLFGLLLAGCQEQVAPELSNPSATTGSGSSTTTPTVSSTLKNFSVDLVGLNAAGEHPNGMLIHKANEIFSEACKVSDIIDTPDAVTSTRDISCLIEAEEYALYFNGVSMKATSGPETCDYIDVKPFTFWRFMPGVSGRYSEAAGVVSIAPRRVIKYTCDDLTKQFNQAQAIAGVVGGATHVGGVTVGNVCDKYVNIDDVAGVQTVSAANIPSLKLTQADLCTFNFKDSATDKAYDCDEGSNLITTVSITSTSIVDANGTITGAAAPVFTASPAQEFKCGGKAVACKGGPGVEYVGSAAYQLGFRSRIQPVTAAGGSTTLAIAAPFAKQYFSNKYLANFMHQQSGDFAFSLHNNFLSGLYNPTKIEDYSKNRTYVTLPSAQEKDSNKLDIVYMAEDAFRGGLTGAAAKYNTTYITHPVYTFTCFDKALDIKARIRVSIREWDRTFAKTTPVLRLTSDLYKNAEDRVLHANGEEQISGGGEEYLPYADYNDIEGWDDFLTFCDPNVGTTKPCGINPIGLETPANRRSPASFPGEGL